MKPISYSCANVIMILFLLLMLPMSFLLKLITHCPGDLSYNCNHRPPIALATVASKRFESLMLSRATPFLTTCAYQFGIKKQHSTEILILLLKRLFRKYIANGSSTYVTMLDVSTAFDKVNHSKLFGKLIDGRYQMISGLL